MNYRQLSNTEIDCLEKQSCSAEDWETILVHENFNTESIRNVNFSGSIKLGHYSGTIELYGGVKKKSGISNATIHNCTIGDNCFIHNVNNYLANINIGNNVIIDNIQIFANEGKSYFGNNLPVSVLDEAGGRQIKIFDHLSAPIAYLMTLYRHKPKLISNLENLIEKYTESIASERGEIGDYVQILDSGIFKNIRIDSNAIIEGASRLTNGSINSEKDAPVYIGQDVVMNKFIVSSGSSISEGSILSDCFVGQGCVIGKQYSAENSLFFANCQGFHGEACSIFAGPFTVTHHKSTLLIAGMYSFLNAGSGSNQSNHMYKLGPIHQGIVERGSKTTSDSYMLWPAKIGAFTLVMGRHYKNSDSSQMPFSYLIERNDKSWLVPGINLRSVGTIRDAMKWPRRDNRKGKEKLDPVNYNILSPYTIQKMINGKAILKNLQEIAGETCEEYTYNNTSISNSALNKGLHLYQLGINKFLGNSVISKIEKSKFNTIDELINAMKVNTQTATCDWIDLAGFIAPKDLIEELIVNIENNCYNNIFTIDRDIKKIHDN